MTISNKAFDNYNSVSHPLNDRARQFGIIEERYQDLKIALVRLAPEVQEKTSNRSYFQAEVPKYNITGDSVVQGSWYEVGGMSTGLMTLYNIGRTIECPTGSGSDTGVDVSQWRTKSLMRIFGAFNDKMIEGLWGAAIVGVESGNVIGFLSSSAGCYVECADLDELIADGWEVK